MKMEEWPSVDAVGQPMISKWVRHDLKTLWWQADRNSPWILRVEPGDRLGQWMIRQWCRAVPVVRTLPLGSPWRKAREVALTWRRLRYPDQTSVLDWRDWYIPSRAPVIVLWRRRDPRFPTQNSGVLPDLRRRPW